MTLVLLTDRGHIDLIVIILQGGLSFPSLQGLVNTTASTSGIFNNRVTFVQANVNMISQAYTTVSEVIPRFWMLRSSTVNGLYSLPYFRKCKGFSG